MKTERQKEIISTALELIETKGIQGLTIKNISKKIGISEPAIYRHFESKIEILTSILDMIKNNSDRLYTQEIMDQKTATAKIERLFQNHFQAFVNYPQFVSVIFAEEIFRNEKALLIKLKELIDHNNQVLIDIIRKGQHNNEIRDDIDTDSLATMILGTLRLYVKKWQLSEYNFNLMEEGNRLIQMVVKMIIYPGEDK
jgi:AcrR family transcriptional regulator